MPFDPTTNKAIQVRRDTDKKLEKVAEKFEKLEGIKLRSRDQIIDMLATRYINTVTS